MTNHRLRRSVAPPSKRPTYQQYSAIDLLPATTRPRCRHRPYPCRSKVKPRCHDSHQIDPRELQQRHRRLGPFSCRRCRFHSAPNTPRHIDQPMTRQRPATYTHQHGSVQFDRHLVVQCVYGCRRRAVVPGSFERFECLGPSCHRASLADVHKVPSIFARGASFERQPSRQCVPSDTHVSREFTPGGKWGRYVGSCTYVSNYHNSITRDAPRCPSRSTFIAPLLQPQHFQSLLMKPSTILAKATWQEWR